MSFNRKVTRNSRRRKVKGKGLTRKQRQQIDRMIEEPKELKFHDQGFIGAGVSTTPTFTDITTPNQGTDVNERIGVEIELKSISFNLMLNKGDDTNWLKMVILQWYPDRQSNGPNWDEIYQYPLNGNPITQRDRMSPLAIDKGTTGTYKIIKTVSMVLDVDNPIQTFRGYINKGFKRRITYGSSTTSGINHIYVMFISDSDVIPHPNISGEFRVRYTDS